MAKPKNKTRSSRRVTHQEDVEENASSVSGDDGTQDSREITPEPTSDLPVNCDGVFNNETVTSDDTSTDKARPRRKSCKRGAKAISIGKSSLTSRKRVQEESTDFVDKDSSQGLASPAKIESSSPSPNELDEPECDVDSDLYEDTSSSGLASGIDDLGNKDRIDDVDKTGVIFCSRIPPFMSLSKLKSYFSRYGKIGKIYAEPESLNDYKRRVKMGGNKKLKFIHGWIEFIDKTVAKRVAAQLNGQPVGEKKRHNFWRDDLWNLLYLPKYKFNDVMAYLRENKGDRKEKLSFHLAKSRKENYNYMEQLEAEKQHKAIEKRKRKQGLPAFEHHIQIRPKESNPKEEEDSEQKVPMGLLGAIVT